MGGSLNSPPSLVPGVGTKHLGAARIKNLAEEVSGEKAN